MRVIFYFLFTFLFLCCSSLAMELGSPVASRAPLLESEFDEAQFLQDTQQKIERHTHDGMISTKRAQDVVAHFICCANHLRRINEEKPSSDFYKSCCPCWSSCLGYPQKNNIRWNFLIFLHHAKKLCFIGKQVDKDGNEIAVPESLSSEEFKSSFKEQLDVLKINFQDGRARQVYKDFCSKLDQRVPSCLDSVVKDYFCWLVSQKES